MKFLQIHSFYDKYIEDFYTQRPELIHAPFETQIDTLVSDGFSGGHLFAPYMRALGYDAQLIVANAAPAQVAWARQYGIEPHPHHWVHQIVATQIEMIKPDVLYISHPIDFDSRFVRMLKWKPKLVFGWRASTVPAETDFSEFSVMLSSDPYSKKLAIQHGAKATAQLVPGIPDNVPKQVGHLPHEFDVDFCGQLSRGHMKRIPILLDVAKAPLGWGGEFSLAYYLTISEGVDVPQGLRMYDHGSRWGMDMYKALRSGSISLNIVGDLFDNQPGNMRQFEIPATGSLMLTEYHDGLRDTFEPGVECETYKSTPELIEKIYHYLKNPAEREAIARRGHQRCISSHLMSVRVKEFESIMLRHLPDTAQKPKVETKVTTSSTIRKSEEMNSTDWMIRAHSLMLSGRYEEAFQAGIEGKRLKQPVRDLDRIRGQIFEALGRLGEAREAYKEELRYFPDNGFAAGLLNEVQSRIPAQTEFGTNDEVFEEAYRIIKPFTMVGKARLYSIYTLARIICENNIPGNFVECGVAAGGSSALLAHVIKRYSTIPRKIFACDSYDGMPTPTAEDTHGGQSAEETGWGSGTCAAPEDSVRNAATLLGASDVLVTVKGYFQDTLPVWKDKMGTIAFLHLDGDWYESTKTILDNLYDQVISGGFMQADDYGHWDGCRKAIHEFFDKRGVSTQINPIDGDGVWFEKPKAAYETQVIAPTQQSTTVTPQTTTSNTLINDLL